MEIRSVILEMKPVEKVETRLNKITSECQLRQIVQINRCLGDTITAV
jgi:hypothetical protein